VLLGPFYGIRISFSQIDTVLFLDMEDSSKYSGNIGRADGRASICSAEL
jgi:hypothetical protein